MDHESKNTQNIEGVVYELLTANSKKRNGGGR
jgi:hypothetical protein